MMNITYTKSFCQQKTDTVVKEIARLAKSARQLPPVSLASPVCQGKKARVKTFCLDFLNTGTLKPQTYPLKRLLFRGPFKQECKSGIIQMPPIFALSMITMVMQSTVYALFPVQGVKHTRGTTLRQCASGDIKQTDKCAPVHSFSLQKVHLWSLGLLLAYLYPYCLASPVSRHNADTPEYYRPNNNFLHQKQKRFAYNQQSIHKIVEGDHIKVLSKIETFYKKAMICIPFTTNKSRMTLNNNVINFKSAVNLNYSAAANSNNPISTTIRKYQQGSVS